MSTPSPTEEQQALIDLDQGSHLIHAPPGSGKTFVLTQRIIRLLNDDPEATFGILALTFTTRAAENLRGRVMKDVGPSAVRRVTACTFHSFCRDVLQHYGQHVDFPSDTTIYSEVEDRRSVLASAIAEEGHPAVELRELNQLLSRIALEKRALRSPESIPNEHRFSGIYQSYNEGLRRNHSCDFDDLLLLTWRLFVEAPRIAKHYRRRFQYIMVDEAQDMSRAQYEILRALCGSEHRNVMWIADSDQFIYKFAGASDRWLGEFQRDFDARRHVLVQNFRCANAIVTAASGLVAANQRVTRSPGAAPGIVEAFSFSDTEAEAQAVADWASKLLQNGMKRSALLSTENSTIAAEEICILCRNHYGLKAIVEACEERGLPVHVRSGQNLVSAEAQFALLGLKVLLNPSDRVTRDNILARWSRAGTSASNTPPAAFFEQFSTDRDSETAGVAKVLATADLSDAGLVIRLLVESLGELANHSRTSQKLEHAEMLQADAETLRDRWQAYAAPLSSESRSVSGFLGEFALSGSSVIEGPGIRILTIHVAKGLEFKAVAVVGMNEGTLPDYRAQCQEELDGEERLTYVAVTRASRVLLLTRPRVREMPWGDLRSQTESRFFKRMAVIVTDVVNASLVAGSN